MQVETHNLQKKKKKKNTRSTTNCFEDKRTREQENIPKELTEHGLECTRGNLGHEEFAHQRGLIAHLSDGCTQTPQMPTVDAVGVDRLRESKLMWLFHQIAVHLEEVQDAQRTVRDHLLEEVSGGLAEFGVVHLAVVLAPQTEAIR
jgi:hypothetical protein